MTGDCSKIMQRNNDSYQCLSTCSLMVLAESQACACVVRVLTVKSFWITCPLFRTFIHSDKSRSSLKVNATGQSSQKKEVLRWLVRRQFYYRYISFWNKRLGRLRCSLRRFCSVFQLWLTIVRLLHATTTQSQTVNFTPSPVPSVSPLSIG